MATFVITGTDTGVGKTVLTTLLARHLGARGIAVAALKPICSGGRGDARMFRAALDGALTLDEINPWHFRAPLAPLLAARRERKRVTLREVTSHVRAIARRHDMVLVEGAGGLLSPLGEGFVSRDLIAALHATPIIVAPNRLGTVGQVRLVLDALSDGAARRSRIVLVDQQRRDSSAASNAPLLRELTSRLVVTLPWLGERISKTAGRISPALRRSIEALLR
ncbi:MAG TPA: dethiobiotin synthase [Verrucomicrobiae bacterium]